MKSCNSRLQAIMESLIHTRFSCLSLKITRKKHKICATFLKQDKHDIAFLFPSSQDTFYGKKEWTHVLFIV